MPLFVPEDHIETLFTFSQLSDEIKEATYKIVSESKLGDKPLDLAKIISDQFDTDLDEMNSALQVFFILIRTINRRKLSTDEIVEEINNSILANGFDFDHEDLKSIENSVRAFLSIKSENPLITALAYDLASNNQTLYLGSTIQDELRPVFYNENIACVALYHTIRLHLRNDDMSHKDLYITLEKADLDDLSDEINKAKLRIKSIKEKYGESIIQI